MSPFAKMVLSIFVAALSAVSAPVFAKSDSLTEGQVENARQNMEQVKQNLDRRSRQLEEAFQAIQKEAEEIAKMGGGQTLRGSRANAYTKRVNDLQARKIEYQKAREQLDADYRLYEEALQKMKAGVDAGGPAKAGAAVSAGTSGDMERVKAEIEDRRKRLVEEFAALQEEKTRISAGGSSQGGGASISEQMADWQKKMRDHAQRRRSFNDAVRSFNQTTGQSLEPLAPL